LGYRSVNEMLNSMSSTELTEWIAYERVAGPLGDSYTHEVLASIQEHLQMLLKVQTGEDGPDPKPIPRPHELHDKPEREDT
jgi:hypothetical protein